MKKKFVILLLLSGTVLASCGRTISHEQAKEIVEKYANDYNVFSLDPCDNESYNRTFSLNYKIGSFLKVNFHYSEKDSYMHYLQEGEERTHINIMGQETKADKIKNERWLFIKGNFAYSFLFNKNYTKGNETKICRKIELNSEIRQHFIRLLRAKRVYISEWCSLSKLKLSQINSTFYDGADVSFKSSGVDRLSFSNELYKDLSWNKGALVSLKRSTFVDDAQEINEGKMVFHLSYKKYPNQKDYEVTTLSPDLNLLLTL